MAAGGGIALGRAVSYGGLVRRMTESGGEYLFLSRIVRCSICGEVWAIRELRAAGRVRTRGSTSLDPTAAAPSDASRDRE